MRRGRRRAKQARAFAEELHKPLDEETEVIQEGERVLNEKSDDEPRPATEDGSADELLMIWQQRFAYDPAGALNDLTAMTKELGYELAYAGRTIGAPVTERTYRVINPDERKPITVFDDGEVDLTLLEVCLWSELAFKRGWRASPASQPDLRDLPAFELGNGAGRDDR
jgi:hypothetical protein